MSECIFKILKQKLSFSLMLSFSRREGKFILDTNASNIKIGAALSQKQEGMEKVDAYFIRVLNKIERNFCVIRQEFLAIVDSIKFFWHYFFESF